MLRNLQKMFGLSGTAEPVVPSATPGPSPKGDTAAHAARFEADIATRREALLRQCGPIVRDALESYVPGGDSASSQKAREARIAQLQARIAAATPLERGQCIIDLYRLDTESWHPLWKTFPTRIDDLGGFNPRFMGSVWGTAIRPEYISRDHDVAFTEDGAAELLRLRLAPDPDRPFKPSLDKGLVKPLARAFTAPNDELAALIRNTFGPHGKEYQPLLQRLCPVMAAAAAEARPARKGNRHAVAAAEAMDALELEMRRRPGLWLRLKPSAAGGAPGLGHQLFPYSHPWRTLEHRLNEARELSVDVADTIGRMEALIGRAQQSLPALEAGQVVPETLSEVLARLPQGEEHTSVNPYWTQTMPSPDRFLFDPNGRPKTDLIARTERAFLERATALIAGFRTTSAIVEAGVAAGGDTKSALLARLSDLLPSGSTAKPSKAWITRARDTLGQPDLALILKILGSHTPDGSHREEHEALVYMGRAKPPEFRQEQMVAMAWAAHLAPAAGAAPVLEGLAGRCYAKQRHYGAANARLGNAAATALSLLPDDAGLPALARLRDLA
jgi:hypothetical protein